MDIEECLALAAEFHRIYPEADTSDQTDEELGLELAQLRDELLEWKEAKGFI